MYFHGAHCVGLVFVVVFLFVVFSAEAFISLSQASLNTKRPNQDSVEKGG